MDSKIGLETAGYTMVELLIALTLGAFLAGSLIALFVGSKRTYNDNERSALLQENGRTALFVLANELRHANFWGPVVNVANIIPPSSSLAAADSSLDTCATWASSMTNPFVGSSAPATHSLLSCMGATEIKADTSAVAIKRVGNNPMPWASIATDSFFLRGHSMAGQIVKKISSTDPGPPATGQSDWAYQTVIYYIRPFAETAGDGIPTLCAITGNPTLTNESIVEGIEDLHIEYGVDWDDDGMPNSYQASPSAADMEKVVSVKIYLLVRDIVPDPLYNHSRSYQLGSKTTPELVDHFHRAVFSTTVIPQNQRVQILL